MNRLRDGHRGHGEPAAPRRPGRVAEHGERAAPRWPGTAACTVAGRSRAVAAVAGDPSDGRSPAPRGNRLAQHPR
ncbi:hypothetical protein CD934_14365 [Streptomyces calvus]|uniref:Uncharacterized protein n=1 Tax=Streptomyces calvus TaxID=67282 RepID=A0A514JR29_9ACTN|nr:hypothetical protein CD934_14365 [Streptomyces calvus]